MKITVKLISIGICAFTVSGCAFTGDVLQAAYDNKAEKECRSPFNGGSVSCGRQTQSKWEKYREKDK